MMMKGGFYGLRAKQLVLVLAAVAFTAIIFFGWAKTPIIFSMVPPQNSILNLAPDEIKEKQIFDGENASEAVRATVAIVSPLNTTITNTFTSENGTKSTASLGTIEDEIKKKQAHEGENSSEGVSTGAATVAPVNSTIFNPFTSENEEKNSTASVETIEETITENEVAFIKQVSKGENKSEHTVHESVVPAEPVSTNLSLPGIENVKAPVRVQTCNYAKGKWITDDNRPLYSGFGCKQWLSGMWACRLTQRTDFEYEKLRWKPKDCEMEDFTGSKFLRRMRNKTLAFIGDSLGRQQFQSLMCMVTGGEERLDVLDVGWEYGLVKARGHVRPDGWVYRFPRTNTTILYYWSASLCDLEPLDITNPSTDFAMHLDRPPAFLRNFIHKFDVLVLNTGHHWNREKLNANRWVIYVGGKPNTNRRIADIAGAKNFTIYSIVNWVNSELPKYPGLKAFYRSISPRHFFNGDWNTGGTCDNTTPRSGELEVSQDESIDPLAAGSVKGTRVKLLDITALSQLRDEGHISRYSLKATPGVQDCLHWCLPGVPDTWNELLFAQL